MSFFNEIQGKISITPFFSNMGKVSVDDNKIIYFQSIQACFESSLNVEWLPTSPTQDDPFYIKQEYPKDLVEMRLVVSKAVIESLKAFPVPDSQFQYDAHNFKIAARNAICYAFRQYLTEKYFNYGDNWERIIQIYYQGHFPIGFYKKKLVVI
ncbi:TPA: hypothetical protein ACXN3T_002890 [Proteus mirabilis]